jgi:hypothetical protein
VVIDDLSGRISWAQSKAADDIGPGALLVGDASSVRSQDLRTSPLHSWRPKGV